MTSNLMSQPLSYDDGNIMLYKLTDLYEVLPTIENLISTSHDESNYYFGANEKANLENCERWNEWNSFHKQNSQPEPP